MVFTVYGQSGTALLWGPSGTRPDGISIGTGSQAITINTSGLVTPSLYGAFNTIDISTVNQITYQRDFDSVSLSGLDIKEFMVSVSGEEAWSIDGIPGVQFDGSQELQVRYIWEIY